MVSGCNDCPLAHADDISENCHHPAAPEPYEGAQLESTEGYLADDGKTFVFSRYITPDWCPLRIAPLVLTLEPR